MAKRLTKKEQEQFVPTNKGQDSETIVNYILGKIVGYAIIALLLLCLFAAIKFLAFYLLGQ